MRRLLVVASMMIAALTLSAGSSAESTRDVKVSFDCDKGIHDAVGQVWLLRSPVADYGDLAAEHVGMAILSCGQRQPSFHAKTEIIPSASFSYVHVEFGAAACGVTGCRYLCILGWPGLGFHPTLPIKESCTVRNEDKHEPSVTLTVK